MTGPSRSPAMCPEKEIDLRIRENLVHFYEKNSHGKVDRSKMVKEFKRSAAGIELTDPTFLRNLDALRSTVNYLLTELIRDTRRPYSFLYDFIFDRLRAVRQEIVVQELSTKDSLELLEPIVIFLAYSSYQLCEAEYKDFDPKICNQHLQECLKKTLTCYDTMKDEGGSVGRRPLIECIYLVFNLGSEDSISRAVSIHNDDPLRYDPDFQTCWLISRQVWEGNYFRAFKLSPQLTPLLQGLIFAHHAQKWRRILLIRFHSAFSSPNVIVPNDYLRRILKYQDQDEHYNASIDYYKIERVTDRDGVRFVKNQFNGQAPVERAHKEISFQWN